MSAIMGTTVGSDESKEYYEGRAAYRSGGDPRASCPYPGYPEHDYDYRGADWMRGWRDMEVKG
jgi:hypothetical protein